MSEEDTVDELVDKVIDEALIKTGFHDEEIKKRKPKPFRYLTDKNEIRAELAEQLEPVSVMKPPESPKIVDDFMKVVGMGDVETIENVIKKHEVSKKFKGK